MINKTTEQEKIEKQFQILSCKGMDELTAMEEDFLLEQALERERDEQDMEMERRKVRGDVDDD
jgi:hypothetical protein